VTWFAPKGLRWGEARYSIRAFEHAGCGLPCARHKEHHRRRY